MKFTDGYWLKRKGFSVLHPSQLRDTDAGEDSLTAYATTKPVRARADTLDTPLITIRLEAPAPDVIRVTLGHFLGGAPKGPNFAMNAEDHPVTVDARSITSGALTARFREEDDGWGLDFLAEGRRITGSGWRGMGIVDSADGEGFVHEQLDLGVGEAVYGLGERFGPFVKNGQSIDI